jgi:hypothetical protein
MGDSFASDICNTKEPFVYGPSGDDAKLTGIPANNVVLGYPPAVIEARIAKTEEGRYTDGALHPLSETR